LKLLKHKSGLFIREGTYDKQIVPEVLKSYAWMKPKGETVLDVGGCFGAYSVLASKQGAENIYCYEPEPNNFAMVCKNTGEIKNIKAYNSALVTSKEKEISFYLTHGVNHGNFSTTEYRGRKEIKVKATNFYDVLNRIKPSTIKMDCEGSEYDLLQKPLPSFVKKITVEIHFGKKAWRKTSSHKLVEMFKDWKTIITPKIGEKNWHTLGGWER